MCAIQSMRTVTVVVSTFSFTGNTRAKTPQRVVKKQFNAKSIIDNKSPSSVNLPQAAMLSPPSPAAEGTKKNPDLIQNLKKGPVEQTEAGKEEPPKEAVEKAPETVEEEKKTKLEQMQLRQKIMEEQNRKKKALLAKAIADR